MRSWGPNKTYLRALSLILIIALSKVKLIMIANCKSAGTEASMQMGLPMVVDQRAIKGKNFLFKMAFNASRCQLMLLLNNPVLGLTSLENSVHLLMHKNKHSPLIDTFLIFKKNISS